MDCRLTEGELVSYYFATTSDEERDRIDTHLLECTACLRAYLRVKHHVERGTSLGARPSPATKARLRADVAAAFRPTAPDRVRRWLGRPIPLYQGLAAAAVALLVAGTAPAIASWIASPGARPTTTERIDTSRANAESLTFY
jgi:anti-sigma factor RsiW